jgi:REP-associated tyrosine transposase
MPRLPRVVVPGLPHHVTARGNRGLDVFFTADDRQQYLVWLARYAQLHGLRTWAYCLMPNHVHLVVVPSEADSIARVLRPLQMRCAQRTNGLNEWAGHVWQDRYYSCVMDDAHLWEAVRYVERNPVRARLVEVAEAYPWSSAPAHCDGRPDPVLSPDLPLLQNVDDWSAWLRDAEDEELVGGLRRRTQSGRPCGGPDLVRRIEELLGLRLLQRSPGRPRKASGN